MRRLRLFSLLLLGGGVAFAATHWPRVHEVETGHSKEYPHLTPRHYDRSPPEVARAVEAAMGALRGWRLLGSGSGAGGYAVQADHRLFPYAPATEEVTISIRSSGTGARLSVLSRSRLAPWDFGQNARNIRELLAFTDERLAPKRKKVGESSS